MIFRDRLGYVNETYFTKDLKIGLAYCRSFPGIEMMELQLSSLKWDFRSRQEKKSLKQLK
jgi:hypothetical protein